MSRIRIGTVGYLNARPLTDHLDAERYEVVADHPRAISERLASGDVAAALVPVAAMLSDGDFQVVPGWCIGADGAVHSVLLVAETPPESWTDVVLDGESRTSVQLAQLLLRRGPLADRIAGDLPVRTVAPGAGVAAATGSTAAVVIGDAARDLPGRLTHRIDLAEAWKDWTGKPFVFAVWAAKPGLPQQVRDDLRAAGDAGVAEVPERYTGDDLTYLTEHIRYPLDEPALIGLRWFASLAHRDGLVGTEHVAFLEPEAVPRASRPDLHAALSAAVDGEPPSVETVAAWLAHLPDADLHAAAHLRRAALHGDTGATYLFADRCGNEADLDQAALRNVTAVVVPEHLQGAAGVRGLQVAGATEHLGVHSLLVETLHADQLGAAHLLGVTTIVTVRVGRDEALIARLAAIREVQRVTASIDAVQVWMPLPPGSLVEPGRATTARWMRAVSLARLMLPTVPHITLRAQAQGLDMAQAALFVGANDLGRIGRGVSLHAGATFNVDLEQAERVLRVAGLEPIRRDARFQPIGGALTQHRKIRRPEERATLG